MISLRISLGCSVKTNWLRCVYYGTKDSDFPNDSFNGDFNTVHILFPDNLLYGGIDDMDPYDYFLYSVVSKYWLSYNFRFISFSGFYWIRYGVFRLIDYSIKWQIVLLL